VNNLLTSKAITVTVIKNTIDPIELQNKLFTSAAPIVIDVRKLPAFDQSGSIIPTACWQDYLQTDIWGHGLSENTEIVLYCVHGHQVSQTAATLLQSTGKKARYLRGGFAAWQAINGPTISAQAAQKYQATAWLTHERPSINRIACYWLIRRFINPQATIHWVDKQFSKEISDECLALPFAINDVDSESLNSADSSSFTTLIQQLKGTDPVLSHLAAIVNAATAKDYDRVPETAGLTILIAGLVSIYYSGRDCSAQGLQIFDALYSGLAKLKHKTA